MELTGEVEVGLEDLLLDVVDVEVALHAALGDAVLELGPQLALVLGLLEAEVHVGLVLEEHGADHGDLGEGFVASAVGFDEGVVVVDGGGVEGDGGEFSELVEDVPGDLGGQEGLAVGDAFGKEIGHGDLKFKQYECGQPTPLMLI